MEFREKVLQNLAILFSNLSNLFEFFNISLQLCSRGKNRVDLAIFPNSMPGINMKL